MSIVEATNAFRTCSAPVELQIAREPTFVLDEELGNTLGDILVYLYKILYIFYILSSRYYCHTEMF